MNPLRRTLIINKLAQMGCASLDPAEITRCLSGCCAAPKMTRAALAMAASGEMTMQDVRSVP